MRWFEVVLCGCLVFMVLIDGCFGGCGMMAFRCICEGKRNVASMKFEVGGIAIKLIV